MNLAGAARNRRRSRVIHPLSLGRRHLPLFAQNGGNYRISAKSMKRGTFRAVIVSTTWQRRTGWSVRQNETAGTEKEERREGGEQRGTNNDERMAL